MSESVSVCVRFRPVNQKEGAQGGDKALCAACAGEEVKYTGESSAQPKRFTYDSVFDPSAGQEDVFQAVGRPIVDNVLKGFNASVLAYGQTGSGKTHSMMGPGGGKPACLDPEHETYAERGLMPRIVEALFESLNKHEAEEVEWSVTVQCFELYKEAIRDLCCPANEQKDYRIREDRLGGKGVYVDNIVEKPCETAPDVLRIVREATGLRQTASTGSNDTSSRSHFVTLVTVLQANMIQESRTRASLHLVDLAGSEKVSKTGAAGERLKEAQMINLSLTLLGNVIFKLTDGKSVHIPYRDSKLTRLLQDSFGGNSRTTLLCNCSPHVFNSPETLSTLQFASRAKMIQNKPVCGKELSGDELRMAYMRALEEIRDLKDQLRLAQGQSYRPPRTVRGPAAAEAPAAAGAPPGAKVEEDAEREQELEDLRGKLAEAQDERNEARTDLYQARSEQEALAKELQWCRARLQEGTESTRELKEKLRTEQKNSQSWARRWQDRDLKDIAAASARAKPAESLRRKPSSGNLAGHAGKAMRKSTRKTPPGQSSRQGTETPPEAVQPTDSKPAEGTRPADEAAPTSARNTPPESEEQSSLFPIADGGSGLAPVEFPPDPELLQKIEALERDVGAEKKRAAAAERQQADLQREKEKNEIERERDAAQIDALQRQIQLLTTKLDNSETDLGAALRDKERLEANIQEAAVSHEEKERLLGRQIQDGADALKRLRDEHSHLGELASRLRDAAAQREYLELVEIEMVVKEQDISESENDINVMDVLEQGDQMRLVLAGNARRTLTTLNRHFEMIHDVLNKEPFTAVDIEAKRRIILEHLKRVLDRVRTSLARVESLSSRDLSV